MNRYLAKYEAICIQLCERWLLGGLPDHQHHRLCRLAKHIGRHIGEHSNDLIDHYLDEARSNLLATGAL